MTSPASDIDIAKVADFVAGRLPGFDGTLRVEKFAMGQSNPTYLLDAGEHRYVLRRKPLGNLLKSAHAVDREFRVQSALQQSGVQVPRMHLLCEDDDVIGAAFYIMDHVAGRNFADPRLPKLPVAARRAPIDEMNRVLAALHEVDPEQIGLSDFGPPGDYFARQLARWTKQYRASETRTIAAMDRLIQALGSALPPDDGQRRLVHGDFRIDNMIFSPDGQDCRAVLDWELSTIGHPYADLAGVIMQWQMPPGTDGRGLAGIDRQAEGLMTDQAFIDAYCQRRGLPGIDNFGFYLGFSFFRMAAILQGVLKRALDGNASNPDRAMTLGGYVPSFAQAGLQALDDSGV
ncbi:phosphotransferase family protein [Tritonibacter horizontis]|uniref:Putative aminoglycoside phosphotransferase n=1 Tax=Tritonibacter horizontis TaxID=1768241 RepID=A0A132BWR6_9RHOB|nr:phosphotransferase family protein [Tritonibacter horizontis]KUP92646.1 putative aminoglycoside phosphotransferase [Tritonibacter horizontis]